MFVASSSSSSTRNISKTSSLFLFYISFAINSIMFFFCVRLFFEYVCFFLVKLHSNDNKLLFNFSVLIINRMKPSKTKQKKMQQIKKFTQKNQKKNLFLQFYWIFEKPINLNKCLKISSFSKKITWERVKMMVYKCLWKLHSQPTHKSIFN